MESPFATGVYQTVEDEGLKDQIPVRSLSSGRKFFAPKVIKTELFPEFATEPTGSPLAWALEAHLREADAYIGDW